LDARYAHAILAKLERYTGHQVQAIRHFEDAVAANPSDVDSLLYLSLSYAFHAGKPAAAAAIAEKLISLDPVPVINLLARAFACWAAHNFTGALTVLEDMRLREPSLRFVDLQRMAVLARLGRNDEACKVAEESLAENNEDAFAMLVTTF
jgi:tetratricopeptide (TPR) repeat protein